jgi:hypothetical protein
VVENVSKAEVDAITKALVEAFDQRLSSDVLYLRRYALNKQRDDNQPQVILLIKISRIVKGFSQSSRVPMNVLVSDYFHGKGLLVKYEHSKIQEEIAL